MDDGIEEEHGELFRLTFPTNIAEESNAGFYVQDRAAQSEISEIITLNELTEAVRRLTIECDSMKRDIGISKAVLTSEFSRKLETKALELYTRMNDQVGELERLQDDRIATVRRAFKMQLTDSLIRVRNLYESDFGAKAAKEQARQKEAILSRDRQIRNLQETLMARDGAIATLKEELLDAETKIAELEVGLAHAKSMAGSQIVMKEAAVVHRTPSPKSPRFTKDEMDAKDDEIDKLKNKLREIEEGVSSQSEQSAQAAKIQAELQSQLDAQRSLVSELEEERNRLKRQVLELEEAVEASKANNEAEWKKQLEERLKSAKANALSEQKSLIDKMREEEQARYNTLLSEKDAMEKKFAEEREAFMAKLDKLKDVDFLRKRESLLQNEIIKLKAELAQMTRIWEKKFQVLRQSMHALKDESYLRQTLQRQAAQLHQATIMYASDLPGNTVLPSVRGGKSTPGGQDHFSYTMSMPQSEQSGIGYFSEDDEQIVASDEPGPFIPYGVNAIPGVPRPEQARQRPERISPN